MQETEQILLGYSMSNRNVSGEMAATVAAQNWLTGTGGSGNREAAAMSRQKQQRCSKLGLAATAERRKGNSETAVTATAVMQIWICDKGCGNMAATAVRTRWLV